MRKKVLVADKSDAIRNIAESLLHQNGFEVLTAATVEKAKQLIVTSTPNLVIIGADMQDNKEIFLYEILAENDMTSKIPMLLIADPDHRQIPFPAEIVLPRPFEPNEFIEKVNLFAGGTEPEKSNNPDDPFNAAAVDDEFLDAALGLDSLQVEDSEEMDKTTTTERSQRKKEVDSDDDYGIARKENEDETDDSTRVESLMIREDGFKESREDKQKKPEDLSSSSKIELPGDPYGISDSPDKGQDQEKEPAEKGNEAGEHDYDWFINEMQKDSANIDFGEGKGNTPDDPPQDDSGPIKTQEAAYGLEQVKPEEQEKPEDSKPTDKEAAEIKEGGVDEFISEFKKEMEHLNQSESTGQAIPDAQDKAEQPAPEEKVLSTDKVPVASKEEDKKPAWEDKLPFGHDDIDKISDRLVKELGDIIAEKLVAKLDKNEIYGLIREALPQALSRVVK